MLALYIAMVARQSSSLEADPNRILRFLLPSIYYQKDNGIDFSRLPKGYRNAPLIASASGTAKRRSNDRATSIQAAAGRDRIDRAMAIQEAADQWRTDQLGAIQAAADQERIDQAMAVRAAADQERIDQAIAIKAAADITIAENAEVCLMSF